MPVLVIKFEIKVVDPYSTLSKWRLHCMEDYFKAVSWKDMWTIKSFNTERLLNYDMITKSKC